MSDYEIIKTRLERYSIPASELADSVITGGSVVSEIVDYFDGNERSHVLQKYGQRYCERITRAESDQSNDNGALYYSDPMAAANAAVKSGKFEIVTLGVGNRIKRIVGMLNQNTEYKYIDDNGDEDAEFTATMSQVRKAGHFNLKLGRLEELSVLSGSAGLLIQLLGNRLDYQPLQANQIKLVYNGSIIDDGEPRPTNTLDIAESSLCIVEMSPVTDTTSQYVAYYPRSEDYPKGRMVRFVASNWYDVPDVGSSKSQDYYDNNDEIANPLTIMQDEANDYTIPEIPIALWYGSVDRVGVDLLPVSDNLLEADKEINLAACRQLFAGVRSATGVYVFSTEADGSPIYSDNVQEGLAQLKPGQSLNILSVPGSNSESLMTSIEKNIAYLSESYGVPAYKLSISQNATVPSGAALIELNKPQTEYRNMRAEINRGNINRVFNIERGLLKIAAEDNGWGDGYNQEWIIRHDYQTMTSKERLDVLLAERKAGIIDERTLVRERVPALRNASDETIDTYLEGLKQASVPSRGTGRFGAAVNAAK